MRIELLLEEPSAEAALRVLVPRIVGGTHTVRLHSFQGKDDLLHRLPERLTLYAQRPPGDWRVVVLVDRDREDCLHLKAQLEAEAARAGLHTRATAAGGTIDIVNRIAVEELEAWFFGDVEALVAAFPRVPPSLAHRRPYRNPDGIPGGTWERLRDVLQEAGYYSGGLGKIDCARRVAQHMDPDRNRSHSFRIFRDALRDLVR